MRRSCRGRGRQLARRTWRCTRGSQRSSARRADTSLEDAHPCTAAPHKCILFMTTLIVLLGSCIHRIVHLVAQLRLIMSAAFSCWAIDGPLLSTYFIFIITHGNFPQVYYGIIILNVESLWCIPVCIAIFPNGRSFYAEFLFLEFDLILVAGSFY